MLFNALRNSCRVSAQRFTMGRVTMKAISNLNSHLRQTHIPASIMAGKFTCRTFIIVFAPGNLHFSQQMTIPMICSGALLLVGCIMNLLASGFRSFHPSVGSHHTTWIEMARRYIQFDVNALCQIAAEACKASTCVSFSKLSEGKIFFTIMLVAL